jgi:nitroreductase
MDIGATALLVHLAAIDEGLAAGFLGLADYAELKAFLAIPADQQPVGIITVGYPAPDRRSGSLKRGRVKADDFVHWETW